MEGEWVKLHHFSPTKLHVVQTDPISSVISGFDADNESDIKIRNESISFVNESIEIDGSINVIESKTDEGHPLIFDSNLKDSFLRTYWVLSQQDDSNLRGKLIFLQKVKQQLLHGICK